MHYINKERESYAMRDRCRAAFTLIEMMVVMAVIAALIAILLPALNKARATAINTRCAANIKQFGTAVFNYVIDNKQNFLPTFELGAANSAKVFGQPYGDPGAAALQSNDWTDRLNGLKYITTAPGWVGDLPPGMTGTGSNPLVYPANSVFTCPEVPQSDFISTSVGRIQTQYWFTFLGNIWDWTGGTRIDLLTPKGSWDSSGYAWQGPTQTDKVPSPASLIIAADAGQFPVFGTGVQMDLTHWYRIGQRQVVSASYNDPANVNVLAHQNSPRVLYLDGSAGGAPFALVNLRTLDPSINWNDYNQPDVKAAMDYFNPFGGLGVSAYGP